MKKQTTLTIVGFGTFGQVLHQLFSTIPWIRITVYSRNPKSISGITYVSLEELTQTDVVIPCVPIHAFHSVVQTLVPYLRPDAILLDVCSVKVYPSQLLLTLAPATWKLVACHPMFGPSAIATQGSAQNFPVVLWNLRATEQSYLLVQRLWQQTGVRLTEMPPEEHDALAARSQAVAQLMGKLCSLLELTPTPLDTPWFRKLLELKSVVERNSPELFLDIQAFNPFAAPMRADLLRELIQLEDDIQMYATQPRSGTIA